jgi:hypothetical protein
MMAAEGRTKPYSRLEFLHSKKFLDMPVRFAYRGWAQVEVLICRHFAPVRVRVRVRVPLELW